MLMLLQYGLESWNGIVCGDYSLMIFGMYCQKLSSCSIKDLGVLARFNIIVPIGEIQWLFSCLIINSDKLGSVAGPAIQAITGRLIFEDDLRSGCLLYFTIQWISVCTELANSIVTQLQNIWVRDFSVHTFSQVVSSPELFSPRPLSPELFSPGLIQSLEKKNFSVPDFALLNFSVQDLSVQTLINCVRSCHPSTPSHSSTKCHQQAAVGHWVSLCVCGVVGSILYSPPVWKAF